MNQWDIWVTCWNFTSWHYLRPYHNEYRLVTVCLKCDFIVLPYWETWPPAPWSDIPLNHITLTLANQSLPYPNNAKHLATKQQVSIFKSLDWLNQVHRFKSHDLQKQEMDAQLIRPSCHVEWDIGVMLLAPQSPSGAALWSRHECALSEVSTHPRTTLNVPSM